MGKKNKPALISQSEYNIHHPSKYFKRVPQLVITKGYEIEATIWQIGEREFFYGPGKEKITSKSGCYLGTTKVGPDGNDMFLLCDPLQPPSHNPRRIEIVEKDYVLLLVKAYTMHRKMLRSKANAALRRRKNMTIEISATLNTIEVRSTARGPHAIWLRHLSCDCAEFWEVDSVEDLVLDAAGLLGAYKLDGGTLCADSDGTVTEEIRVRPLVRGDDD